MRLRAASSCSGVVLGGPAGVGKSRIAREAVAAAQADGALTQWVQATSSAATVPLGVMTDLLADVRSDDSFGLLRAGAEALRARAGGKPIVVGVDDAHLLDPASASLVLHLATSDTAFVLATIRSGERIPDAITSLWKDADAGRLEIDELGEEAILELVEAALGGPVEQAAGRWVFEASGGNVLYVRELLIGAVADSSLSPVDGLWRLVRRPTPSRSLTDQITTRLTGFGEDALRPLELLALVEPLRIDELVELVGSDALAAAEASGVVIVSRERPYEVRGAHPLYGDIVRARMPVVQARALRIRLAELLQQREPRTPDDALRIARLLLDAGEAIPVGTLLEAGSAANLYGDAALGAQLAQLALDQGVGLAAAMLLARALTIRRRYADAEAVLAAHSHAHTSQDQAIEYLEQRVTVLFWGLGRAAEALAVIDHAQVWWSDERWRQRLEPLRLHLLALTASFSAALEPAAAALAHPDLDEPTRRRLEPVHAANLFYSGQGRAAVQLARSIRPGLPLRDQSDSLAFIVCAMCDLEVGVDWRGQEQWLRGSFADAIRLDDQEAAGTSALALGYHAMLSARYRDAERWLAESVVHLERQDVFGALLLAHAVELGVAAMTGDAGRAGEAWQRCRSTLPKEGPRPNQVPFLARATAWALAAGGEPERGAHELLEAAGVASATSIYASALTYEAMLLGAEPKLAASLLAQLRDRCDMPLAAAYADHASALAARDAAALIDAADAFEVIGAVSYAIRCLTDAARTLLVQGRQDSARRAAHRGRQLQPEGQGGIVPVIDGLYGIAVELTPREQQFVALAATGMSNAEIADRLVVSRRTVESHLYRAMRKLGVSDRRDLPR